MKEDFHPQLVIDLIEDGYYEDALRALKDGFKPFRGRARR